MTTALHHDHEAPSREATLDIEGMTCASCVARVEKRLQSVPGVTAAVNLATESAKVTFPDEVDAHRLVQAVREAGYDARVRSVPGQDAWAHAPGGSARRASDAGSGRGEASVTTGPVPSNAVAGEPEATDGEQRAALQSRDPLLVRLVVSAVLAVPVVLLGMLPVLQFPGWQWVSFALATPIVLWGGWPFHRATFANARHGAMTMDTLITLGTGAAYLWSVWALLFGAAGDIGMVHAGGLFVPDADPASMVYFEVASAVTVFLLLGRVIEHRSKRRAGSALRALMELGAKDVELTDGRRVPIDALRVGDEFVVRPGEKIATDGVVVTGAASVDLSMLTGESVPVDVATGSEVTGGTIAADGRLHVRATGVGTETRLARMARLVEDAQAKKSRTQRLADRISGVFVPIVIGIAVVTFAAWVLLGQPAAAGFTAAVAVLIVACPCALGLATPIAILVGTGRGAQLGILITGPEALERADRIDTVVLDKTGTVTTGEMSLGQVTTVAGVEHSEALAVVRALESASEHPVARAIAAQTPAPAAVDQFRSYAGRGVTGVVDGVSAFAGKPAFTAEWGLQIPAELTGAVDAAEQRGTAVVAGWADSDGALQVRAVFAVADGIRRDSAAGVAELKALGADVVLLTGDNETVARAVASAVGIGTVIAGVLPEQKLAEIERLRASGHRVAMVGDGVNDAAALATADLGIAMGGGADAALHASDITLVREGLPAAADALRLSRRTMRIIRGNLFWAFAYNTAAIPLAALGLLNPMIAGAAMAFSSVFVVLNSLRLRRAV